MTNSSDILELFGKLLDEWSHRKKTGKLSIGVNFTQGAIGDCEINPLEKVKNLNGTGKVAHSRVNLGQ